MRDTETALDIHYLRVSTIAERLDMDESTIYKMIKDGELPSVRVGNKSVRIPAPAFEAYLRRHTTPGILEARPRPEVSAAELRSHLAERIEDFRSRTGYDPVDFAQAWNRNEIADTAEGADLAIEAHALAAASVRVTREELVSA